jgi:hypothetical protein
VAAVTSWLNPLKSWGNLGHDIANIVPQLHGLNQHASAPASPGGQQQSGQQPSGGSDPLAGIKYGAPKQTMEDQLSAFAKQYGLDPYRVYQDVKARDPAGLNDQTSLATALGQYAQAKGLGGAGRTSASIIDPLAAQMFFQQTIQPYLNQVAGDEKQTASMLRNEKPVPGLPAEYAAVVKQGAQTQADDFDALMKATQTAAAVQPQVAQLNQMLGLQQKAALQDLYRMIQSGTSGTPNPFGG